MRPHTPDAVDGETKAEPDASGAQGDVSEKAKQLADVISLARLAKHQQRSTLHLNVKLTGDFVDIWNELVGRLGDLPASQILKEAIRLRALVAIGMARNSRPMMRLPTRKFENSPLMETETDLAEFLDLTEPLASFVPDVDDTQSKALAANVKPAKFRRGK